MSPTAIGDWVAGAGLTGGLMALVFAFYKEIIVLGSSYREKVAENKELAAKNDVLKEAGAALLRDANEAAKKVIESNQQERDQATRERELLLRMVASPSGSPSPTQGKPPGPQWDGQE